MTLTFARRRLTTSSRMSSADSARPLRIRESWRLTPRIADRRAVDEELVAARPRPAGTRSAAGTPGLAPPSAATHDLEVVQRGAPPPTTGGRRAAPVANDLALAGRAADRPVRLDRWTTAPAPSPDRDSSWYVAAAGSRLIDVHAERRASRCPRSGPSRRRGRAGRGGASGSRTGRCRARSRAATCGRTSSCRRGPRTA